jgi:monovalent cation:H+ antiporter-2, CPA2 family
VTHLPGLINDLALILIAAGVVTLLFRKLRQPVVLGYLLAGFLVGPHFAFVPTITDAPNIQIWSEIGVIFLLFALGLEFSFKKLMKVGGAASVTASVEVVGMVAIGYVTGKALGWSSMDSLFLGGVLAISSTTIIIRAFDEIGVKGRAFVSLVFGVLVVEDLIAILLLVLLSTVAVTQSFAGQEMLYSGAKLFFFLTLWFVGGIFLIPSFLRRAKPWINQETMLVMAVGLCFAMVVIATKAGFSPALGAFVMGSLLAETVEAERIEHLISPVKDLFAAVFFVSVGMLIDPSILVRYAGPIAVISIVTVLGKLSTTMLGALISGRTLRHSVQAGFSLAQIGEFSFIIAGLGLSLKVTSEFLYPIAVSVSAVTTFATPFLIRSADGFYTKLEKALPQKWTKALTNYSSNTRSVSATSEWGELVRAYAVRMVLHATLISAVFLAVAYFTPFAASRFPEYSDWIQSLSVIAALMIAAPFVWAFAIGRPKSKGFDAILRNAKSRLPVIAIEAGRTLIAIFLIAVLSNQLFEVGLVQATAIAAFALLLFTFSRNLNSTYQWMEKRFVQNFEEREVNEAAGNPPLAPWDAHIEWFKVDPDSSIVGQTLLELGIREKYGVTIALIERGSKKLTAPARSERVYPGDRLAVIGTDEQLEIFKPLVESPKSAPAQEDRSSNYALHQVEVIETSPYLGKTIRDSGLREHANGLIVGIEREGQRMLNPDSTTVLAAGDRLWIVGDSEDLRGLHRENFIRL